MTASQGNKWLDAAFGRLLSAGTAVELLGGINFDPAFTVTPDEVNGYTTVAFAGVLPALTADLDMANYAILNARYIELGVAPYASAGDGVRFSNAAGVYFLGSVSDLPALAVDGSDVLQVGNDTGWAGTQLRTATGSHQLLVGGTLELEVSVGLVDAQDSEIRTTGFLAVGTNPATSGGVRLANGVDVQARNNANTQNAQVCVMGAADSLIFGGDSVAAAVQLRSPGTLSFFSAGTLELAVSAGLINAQDNEIRTTGFAAIGASPATTGALRFSNAAWIAWRNGADSGSLTAMRIDSLDRLIVGGGNVDGSIYDVTTGNSHSFRAGGTVELTIAAGLIDAQDNEIRTVDGWLTLGDTANGSPYYASTGTIRAAELFSIWGLTEIKANVRLLDVTTSVLTLGDDTIHDMVLRGDDYVDIYVNAAQQVRVGASSIDIKESTYFGDNNVSADEYDNGNSGAADTIDWAAHSNKQKSTLTGNVTYTFTAPPNPCSLLFRMVNDGTPGRTRAWPGTVTWTGGSEPVWNTAANKTNIAVFYWDGSTYWGAASVIEA